jgi:hypothetical protein
MCGKKNGSTPCANSRGPLKANKVARFSIAATVVKRTYARTINRIGQI